MITISSQQEAKEKKKKKEMGWDEEYLVRESPVVATYQDIGLFFFP